MSNVVFTAENISKSYGKKQVLKNVSFQIKEGEMVGLFGDSGSGKSTLANILLGLVKKDSGTYTDLKTKLQIAWQQPTAALDPNKRVIDGFVELLKHLKICKNNKDAKEFAYAYSLKFGIEDILNHYPHQISGGEAQRISIAKAMLFNPKLLILDEATSMLDVVTQREILDLVKDLMYKQHTSVLLISHDEKLLKRECKRIYVLKEGDLNEYKE